MFHLYAYFPATLAKTRGQIAPAWSFPSLRLLYFGTTLRACRPLEPWEQLLEYIHASVLILCASRDHKDSSNYSERGEPLLLLA
jgi:hypothetical protein